MLQYMHENGCPWDSNTCTAAAKANSLRCLQYAHEHGCAWDEATYEAARAMKARPTGSNCFEYMKTHWSPKNA